MSHSGLWSLGALKRTRLATKLSNKKRVTPANRPSTLRIPSRTGRFLREVVSLALFLLFELLFGIQNFPQRVEGLVIRQRISGVPGFLKKRTTLVGF